MFEYWTTNAGGNTHVLAVNDTHILRTSVQTKTLDSLMAKLQDEGANFRDGLMLKVIPRQDATGIIAFPDGGIRIEFGSKNHEYAAGEPAHAARIADEMSSVLEFSEARTERMSLFDVSRGPVLYLCIWGFITAVMLWIAGDSDMDSTGLISTLTRNMGPIVTAVITVGILLAIAGYVIYRIANRPAVTAYRPL